MTRSVRFLSGLIVFVWIVGLPALSQPSSGLTATEQTLMEASLAGKFDIVEKLVTEGTPVDTTDEEKHTPLMWASFNGHTEIVGYLIQQGAVVNAKDENGRTSLMYASSGPFPETVELLLKKGADVNVQGTLEGFTALMTAAAEGQTKVIKLLLDHGADASLKDKDGDTAESFAKQKGHPEVVELLGKASPSSE